MTDPILTYPDPNLPNVLFTDSSKYAWACVLTQEKTHTLEGKETKLLHPITYMSGLFRGSQLNWACLTKEAYVIYMSIKKLTYYLEDADVKKCLGLEYKLYTPPYHPASNGRIEGLHVFLNACIAKHVAPQLEWDVLIPLA